MAYRSIWSSKWGDVGSFRSPPAVTATARTLSPNSTTATKLFPLVPYQRRVPFRGAAPKEARDPHRAEVNATGVLGASSSKTRSMSPVRRWNRLISPQGVRQSPKSPSRRSNASARASTRTDAAAGAAM